MSKTSRVVSVLISLVVVACLASPAGAYVYAGKRKKINCGVVVVHNAGGSTVSQPLGAGLSAAGQAGELFYLLDARTDLKPPGWSLENPLAPFSPSLQATGGNAYTKMNPVYWQVDLRSVRNLSRMHVLYLPASGTVNLSEEDREKLREFVDGGGVLWIDNAGDSGSSLNFDDTFFILDFYFQQGMGSGSDYIVSRHHPLLTLPFWLTDSDVAFLGANYGRNTCMPGYDPHANDWRGQPVNVDVLYPVVMNTPSTGDAYPSIAANAYGSGRIVATSNFVGRGCYLSFPYDTPSLKFAYNVIAWASSWTHLRKDPRHSGYSIDTIGGTKLLESWTLPVPLGGSSSGTVDCAPVIYKNIAFYSVGSVLYAMDVKPQEDLDHDGNPDDGIAEKNTGLADKGQDVVWIWHEPNGGRLSAPSLVTAQDPCNPNSSVEAVLVESSSGDVHMLQAFPAGGDGRLLPEPSSILSKPFSIEPNPNPSPPLYANGWIYALDGQARMNAYNPSLECYKQDNNQDKNVPSYLWKVPGNVYQGSATPRCGPIYGFVQNETSGAVVGMLYWFASPWSSGTVQDQEQNDHVYGVPVYVSNDRLKVERINSTGTRVECRTNFREANISSNPAPIIQVTPSVSVTAVYPNSRLETAGVTATNRGYVTFDIAGTMSSDAVVHATYAMDYAQPSESAVNFGANTRLRVPLEPRSNASNNVPPTQVTGMPCMGPKSMIFLNGTRSSSGSGGSVYGLTNDGTTQATTWTYLLHSGLTEDAYGSGVPVPGVIYGASGPTSVACMSNPQAFSSPAVSGDKVFVTLTGGGGDGPSAALACFKARSDFVIRLVENAGYSKQGDSYTQSTKPKRLINETTGRQMQVKVWQPNLIAPASGGLQVSPLLSAVPVPSDMIDYEKGIITFSSFDRLKLRGGTANVMQTSTFTPSLPVSVFVDNIEVPIDFSTWAPSKAVWGIEHSGEPMPAAQGDAVDLSGWNNLLWYYIVPSHSGTSGPPCSGIHSSPVVIGDTVYFVCDDGYMYALPAETGISDGSAISSDSLVWSEKVGSGSGQTNTSIAGSNGVLLVPSADGLHAFSNATTLVADSNRVVEVDGAGDTSWSVDSITWPASIPPAPNQTPAVASGPVNKPARTRYVSGNEILVVNSGANQVVKIDKSGTVGLNGSYAQVNGGSRTVGYVRWIWDKFNDPGNLLRPGQPTELRGPTDAIFWQEIEPPYLVYHCVVADSGNHRVVDLVYRYHLDSRGNPEYLDSRESADPSSGFYLPELNWVTETDSVNEKFVYECIELVSTLDNDRRVQGQNIYAAVSNYRTNPDMKTQGLGGAIIALRYRVANSTGTSTSAGWNYAAEGSGRITAACDRVNWSGERPLANPRYFQVIDKAGTPPLDPGGRYLLICDNYGVYEIGPLDASNPVPNLVRAVTDDDYRTARRSMISESDNTSIDNCTLGVPLVATSVQELPNGKWLISNGYAGADSAATRTFHGEVFEWDFSPGSGESNVPWCSPSIYTSATDAAGVDAAGWEQRMQKSYVYKQPRCAFRQF